MKIGDRAPDFTLDDENGRAARLSEFAGKSPVVLMFYPADNTPGCTRQLCAARDDYDKYAAAGVAVFGVNNGSAGTHKRFADRHNMKAPLLVDSGGNVARAYDALMPIPLMSIINRTVVGIDREGIVRFYERGMPSTDKILTAMGVAPANA